MTHNKEEGNDPQQSGMRVDLNPFDLLPVGRYYLR